MVQLLVQRILLGLLVVKLAKTAFLHGPPVWKVADRRGSCWLFGQKRETGHFCLYRKRGGIGSDQCQRDWWEIAPNGHCWLGEHWQWWAGGRHVTETPHAGPSGKHSVDCGDHRQVLGSAEGDLYVCKEKNVERSLFFFVLCMCHAKLASKSLLSLIVQSLIQLTLLLFLTNAITSRVYEVLDISRYRLTRLTDSLKF